MQENPGKISSPTLQATILFISAVFVSILLMSFFLKMEVVARGRGRLIPLSHVQVVQPEFSGRITAIHVRDGQRVIRGEILIEFDATDATAQLTTLTAEQQRLQIELARINATLRALTSDVMAPGFIAHAKVLFQVPPSLSKHPFTNEQRQLLEAQMNALLASFLRIETRIETNRRAEAVARARISRANASLTIQTERLRMSKTLLAKGAISRSAFLDVEQAHDDLLHERETHQKELEQKIAERVSISSEKRLLINDLRSSLLEREAQIQGRLATLSEQERTNRRLVAAATLEAPVTGTVDQLRVFTTGGVVEPGMTLMRIVPEKAPIEIEATFSNQDIGFMRLGQRANIRLDAYPSERFGFITGKVTNISADSTEMDSHLWGYRVYIQPDQVSLPAGKQHLALKPGMTASIDVVTEHRRIISYFFAPIIRTLQNALGER